MKKKFLLAQFIVLVLCTLDGFTQTAGSFTDVTLNGGSVKHITPNTTSGWARGAFWYKTSALEANTLAGLGLYGAGSNISRIYLGYGTAPWNSTTGLHLLPNGNLGLGILAPTDRLHVAGNIRLSGMLTSQSGSLNIGTAGTKRLEIKDNGDVIFSGKIGVGIAPSDAVLKLYGSSLAFFELANSFQRLQIGIADENWQFAKGAERGDVVFRALGTAGHHSLAFFMPNVHNDGTSAIKFGDSYNGFWFRILNNKTVRINGVVYAAEINVKTDVWSDFVFKEGYNLMPLSDLRNFIERNKHLPDVPSEHEVKEKGVNVSEMNAILLQKIEELTLYVLELERKLEFINAERKNN